MESRLEIKIDIIADMVADVKIKGELSVFVQEYELLNKELTAYTKLGIFRFILNLNDCNYLDSSGIGIIMKLATNASRESSLICVICDRPSILKIFTVSNIEKFIHFVKNTDEGLDYYHLK